MRRWLLPESIEDLLPDEARKVEHLRRKLLDEFALHGFELVSPPLVEYIESLLTGSGRDMDLRTFKLVDQLSGRTMGLRADITPQVARIDSHLLNRRGVVRLCYCGPVVHALPSGFNATREPIQLGAELYGHAGIEADVELVNLLGRVLDLSGVPLARVDFGHAGVFRALAARLQSPTLRGEDGQLDLFAALQSKDLPDLRQLVADEAQQVRDAFLALPGLYGRGDCLERARAVLPDWPGIRAALDELAQLGDAIGSDLSGFDLADLRGYHYHSGVTFAAYCPGQAQAIALGGRYDDVGLAFGRARPATGFSVDVRQLAQLAPHVDKPAAILAPFVDDASLRTKVQSLRSAGEVVVAALPGHDEDVLELSCSRQLVFVEGEWQVTPLERKV
ncbi:MAG: ATP phosphoribosyltransferase regulatory subunit [Gammaproteobacteria bacterium]|jgi:ATP phosphoribosyltransferase regulatory subunit|nr:ATP phosphoribosyltransferase regulatory subunit [Gammaproteobacteria bacterium]MBU0771840.1 ATP phosphoribosyltransferase regulatory subunit [Gammaproteobacteria bacterium]MBU0855596.1 ATP phosphoribosyltransferase regulatory subunit [Gammaproteobacteria bacterium]MBU1846158.1 ATP phosphoribosyltransferase regulatory subunit [Gammaproteobacteria bacterium]